LLWSVVHSWAALVHKHFFNKEYDRSSLGLGDAFRRLLCGNRIPLPSDAEGRPTQGIEDLDDDDHHRIATWFFQGAAHQGWAMLFGDLAQKSSLGVNPGSTKIESAIRAATIRRTFFITKQGYLGLGPANIRSGDKFFILLGAPTPFILRDAGEREVRWMVHQPEYGSRQQECFEVVGDAYVHGLMDGEAMQEWKEVALAEFKGNTEAGTQIWEQALTNLDQAHTKWKLLNERLLAWKAATNAKFILKKLAEHAKLYGSPDNLPTANEFERMVVLSKGSERWYSLFLENGKEVESAISEMSLDTWKNQFNQISGIESMARLARVARTKIEHIEENVKHWKWSMGVALQEVKRFSIGFQKSAGVYLV
jgi:hypothetical protein